jgi:hypothetical protein
MLAVAATPGSAMLPLITDDTATQRPNNTTHQVELSYDRQRDRDSGVTTRVGTPGITYTYGVSEPLDVYIGTTYARVTIDDPDATGRTKISGLGDTGIGFKWRFYDEDNLSLGIKPVITFATGDENKGLGTGRTSWAVGFLATYDTEPVTWLANITYIRNNYAPVASSVALRTDLVRLSAAALVNVHDKVRLFADSGATLHADRLSDTPPAYFLTGLIYSPNKDVDVNFGVKFAINRLEVDRTWSIGATFRF